jgi:mRNA-degrading endonuclease RelE of RelBE toxin-antitoxin system
MRLKEYTGKPLNSWPNLVDHYSIKIAKDGDLPTEDFHLISSCPCWAYTSTFTKILPSYLSDDDYRGLQSYLLQKPDAGDIVRGSGGVRKVRWAPSGRGKSGGVYAIYYWEKSEHEIWMLTMYSKSERGTISSNVLKQIAEAIDHE